MLSAIKKRRSHRAYLDRQIEEEKMKEILLSAMSSPSGYNRRPWEFVIVKKEEMKNALSRASNYATFAKQAPVIIVLTAQEDQMWVEDAAIAASHIYLEATNQRLGTCWIQIHGMETPEGENSETYVKELLGIPKSQRVLCIMPIGYESDKLPEHDRTKYIEEKIHLESW